MDQKFLYTIESGYLHAKASGEFEIERAKARFADLVNEIEKIVARKVFVDGLAVTGDPLVIERFYYGEFAAEAINGLLMRGWTGATPQIAYVLKEPQLDPYRLGETVAVNRGVNIKVFDNHDEAFAWLNVERGATESAA